jgi:hypothetical protein
MRYEITPYINPNKPETTYYKATCGNETYHHSDRAIVELWVKDQVKNYHINLEKQRLTEKAIDAFYKK